MGRVDYYQLLGVDRSASTAEIKSAYRSLAKRTHPDVGGSADAFQLLQEAYETLADPERRSAHDLREAMRGGIDPFRTVRGAGRFRPRAQSAGTTRDAGPGAREERRTESRNFRARRPADPPRDPPRTPPPRTQSPRTEPPRTQPRHPEPEPQAAEPTPAAHRATATAGPATPSSTTHGPAGNGAAGNGSATHGPAGNGAAGDGARNGAGPAAGATRQEPRTTPFRVPGPDAFTAPSARPKPAAGPANGSSAQRPWARTTTRPGDGRPGDVPPAAPPKPPKPPRSRPEPPVDDLDDLDEVSEFDLDGLDGPADVEEPREAPRNETRRHTGLGEDPGFQPSLPQLDTRYIPWWRTVDLTQRVRYLPATGPGRAQLLGALCGCVLLVLPVALTIGLGSPLFYLWLIALAAMLALAAYLGRRWLLARRTDRELAGELGGRTVFGRPGREPDQLAERLTAQLLSEYLMWLPGARIFHGLSYPDSVFADVDHAVLCGRKLVLIESKLWLPGHYVADEYGELWRNDHPFRGGSVRLPEGVAAFRELLPEVEVRGALLLYPSRAGKITTGTPPEVPAPPMTPERFVREIGGWIAAEPAVVHRDTFRTVLDRLITSVPAAERRTAGR